MAGELFETGLSPALQHESLYSRAPAPAQSGGWCQESKERFQIARYDERGEGRADHAAESEQVTVESESDAPADARRARQTRSAALPNPGAGKGLVSDALCAALVALDAACSFPPPQAPALFPHRPYSALQYVSS